MRDKRLKWGLCSLTVEFRKDEETFRKGLPALPAFAKKLNEIGANRVMTWNTMVPALRVIGDHKFSDAPGFIDTRWVENGSFIRGKSINLSYSFDKKVVKSLHMGSLSIYGNVQNFFLITIFLFQRIR